MVLHVRMVYAPDHCCSVVLLVQDLNARAFLIVTDSALLKLQPRDAVYTADLAFMEALSWGSFEDKSTLDYAKAKRFLRLLGDRTTKAARKDSTGRLCVMAAQIGAAFNKVNSEFTMINI